MRKNSTVFPAKKMQMYKQATELPKKYKVMALVKMNKVRASQILDLRKKLLGEVEFLSVKNRQKSIWRIWHKRDGQSEECLQCLQNVPVQLPEWMVNA